MSVQNFACVAPRLFSSLISVTGQRQREKQKGGHILECLGHLPLDSGKSVLEYFWNSVACNI